MSKRQTPTEGNEKLEEGTDVVTDYTDGGEREDCALDTRENFWKHVLTCGATSHVTLLEQLVKQGIELPAPDALSDDQLSGKLWEMVGHLASRGVFLSETDHLSDRELYQELWGRILREERRASAWDRKSAYHIDILDGCSQPDLRLYLRYYADEDFRRQWTMDFPEHPIPDAENPPFDRDRFLPRPDYGPHVGLHGSGIN